jgi:protocatechuate 3,4-dioxygenase beta subunit
VVDNDDILVGRLLSRREVLALLGAGGMALVIGCSSNDKRAPTAQAASADATGETAAGGTSAVVETETAVPACVVTPALTEGPYFVDEMLNRSDIRSDPGSGEVRDGAELTLTLNVYHVTNSCGPLEGATVDLWHCDAQGVYSDVTDNAEDFQTVGQKFLRGYQTTDSSGQVKFTTIYPGWYQGRATHVHFKVRKDNRSSRRSSSSTMRYPTRCRLLAPMRTKAPPGDCRTIGTASTVRAAVNCC